MSFFQGMEKKLRDKTRDKLCADLCAIGLDARLVEGRRPEKRAGAPWGGGGSSLGLIEIKGEPICWVNVLKTAPIRGGIVYTNVYLVPDASVSNKGHLRAESTRVKSMPVFGRVVDIRWEGQLPANLINQMNGDTSLKERLIELEEDIFVCSYPELGCWAIITSRHRAGWVAWGVTRPSPPSKERWDCYKAIANYLLKPIRKA